MFKNLTFLLIISMMISLTAISAEASNRDIRVVVNNVTLTTDVAPIIEAGRTLVPVRAVLEALGATVQWRSDGVINITKNSRQILLRINDRVALINGQQVILDVPARLVTGRTLVPLRFISEAVGATVNWHQNILTAEVILLPLNKLPVHPPAAPPAEAYEIVSVQGQRLSIGMSAEELVRALGEPNRREPTLYGYNWWVYSVPDGLLLAGVANNVLAAVYTDSPAWEIAGLAPSDSFDTLSGLHSLEENVHFRHLQTDFTIHIESEAFLERPLVLINGKAVTFYLDTARNREISAIRIMDFQSFLATGGYSMSWRTTRTKRHDFGIPVLTDDQRRHALAGQERIMFDLVNSFRVRNGLNALSWHAALADVARGHSLDMFINNFFSHHSASTGSPADRVRRANIDNIGVGENLVVGTPDSIDAHHGLLNSPGHRTNILFKRYTHLGVGIVERYYTQKFLIQ
jgi:uncharacterized protein YkwD